MSWWRKRDPMMYDDESSYIDRFPQHVVRAFLEVGYERPDHIEVLSVEEAIESFVGRWGGIDDMTLLHVIQVAHGPDRLVAIFAIGHRTLTQTQDLLLPLLESPDQLERCASACCFALKRDERAIPVLLDMLVHDPPTDKRGWSEPGADPWYYSFRGRIARLFATWGPPTVVPVLRHAFVLLWEREQHGRRNEFDYWYQDATLYAIGRRGALGALSGMALPVSRLRLALVFLALGYVRADERFDDLHREMLLDRELRLEVARVLQEHFGLSVEESQEYSSHFGEDFETRMNALYTDEMGEASETETQEP